MSDVAHRTPDAESEHKLLEIRRQAEEGKLSEARGIQPLGAPFPQLVPDTKTVAERGYYGIPLLKEPQWTKEVPLYFFAGGAAGAAAVIASMARYFSGAQELARSARWVAAAGALISPGLLTSDLGRPSRFLNMLRVFKLQSPMSVGAWTLTAFSSSAAAAAFAGVIREKVSNRWPIVILQNAAEMLAAATGVVMASYTGVLIGATVIPVWNENVGTLPIHFAASGMNSATSILELMGHDDSRALNALGIAASAYETVEGAVIESRQDRVNRPLRQGKSGLIVRLGGVLSGPVPLLLRLGYAVTGNKKMRRVAAVCSLAGSMLTRFGWIEAGKASARDHVLPLTGKQTVVNG
jgi:formate-dependent nitrite reductase membrane component NrfD